MIRWGMIGCGAVTERKSAPAFRQAPGSTLVAVMGRDPERLKVVAQQHAIPHTFTDAQALIQSPDVDAVYIATPPDSHCDYALQVAAAGKPCCVEKPMAVDRGQCQRMVDAFAQKNLPLFVSYYRRSLPRFLQIRQWLEQERIGAVRHVHWQYCRPPSDWDLQDKPQWRTASHRSGGGYFHDLASHGLDLLLFLLGDVTTVHGIASRQQQLYPAHDAITACWEFASGATGSGSWHFAAATRQDQVTLSGSRGQIRFSVLLDAPLVLDTVTAQESVTIPNPDPVQLYHVINMVRHLRGEGLHPSTGATALQTSALMDRILGVTG